MRNILIGGEGFVGTYLKEVLDKFSILDIISRGDEWCDINKPKSLEGKITHNSRVILLAAEHRDDVFPISKYYETNVSGTQNVLNEMDRVGCKNLIFTSSVAVYGLNKSNPNEKFALDPFNDYGKSKLQAEMIIKKWYDSNPKDKNVIIIRPTVIFGENNRGNVYNLLRQISSGKFIMIGNGKNKKSMAYIRNIVNFIKFCCNHIDNGFHVFNYADKPDFNMIELKNITKDEMNIKLVNFQIPFFIGLIAGYFFDIVFKTFKIKFPVSSVRVKKFCATTQFDSSKAHSIFKPPYSLENGIRRTLNYEFKKNKF